MLDLENYSKYVDRIDTALRSCAFASDIREHRYVRSEQLQRLAFEVQFIDGSRLIVTELFVGAPPANFLTNARKKIAYQYMEEQGQLIFRLDCHEMSVPLTAPLHLDLPQRKHIHDGDPLLKGVSVAEADFFTVYKWICGRLALQPLPWEEDADAKA
ncbi:MAG TPA: hypothetical protein VM865_00605 [Acidobacteriaceae bacterium]|nr:hypothetical protein [Acidobacteriaceae bacterium]